MAQHGMDQREMIINQAAALHSPEKDEEKEQEETCVLFVKGKNKEFKE